jgi:hypothetical protein
MNDCILKETVEIKGHTYTIKVYPDEVDSPLESYDGVHITYRKGARCTLGNTPLLPEDHHEIAKRIDAMDNPGKRLARALDGEHVEPLIGLAVHAYIHSGTFLSASPWQGRLPQGHAEFDSAQSGFIYVTRKTALEWMGGKHLTERKIRKVKESLTAALDEYSKWLNGECYQYVVEDAEGSSVGGCGGFIGMDYMLEEARHDAASAHKRFVQEKAEARYWLDRGVPTVQEDA